MGVPVCGATEGDAVLKAIYLAAPYRGTPEQVEANILRVKCIARQVADMGHLPIVPHLALSFCSDDSADWATALYCALKLLERCDELWVVGDISEGVADEIAYAKGKEIPVIEGGRFD